MAYLNKSDFLRFGLEPIQPSQYAIYSDCIICKDTFVAAAPSPRDSRGSEAPESAAHAAVRIKACRHIHGNECLLAWLETGHTCPTCNRILFMPEEHNMITQRDVNAILKELGPQIGEYEVMRYLARYMMRSDNANVRNRHQIESTLASDRLREEERTEYEKSEMAFEEWYDTDEEEDDEDEEDEEYPDDEDGDFDEGEGDEDEDEDE